MSNMEYIKPEMRSIDFKPVLLQASPYYEFNPNFGTNPIDDAGEI